MAVRSMSINRVAERIWCEQQIAPGTLVVLSDAATLGVSRAQTAVKSFIGTHQSSVAALLAHDRAEDCELVAAHLRAGRSLKRDEASIAANDQARVFGSRLAARSQPPSVNATLARQFPADNGKVVRLLEQHMPTPMSTTTCVVDYLGQSGSPLPEAAPSLVAHRLSGHAVRRLGVAHDIDRAFGKLTDEQVDEMDVGLAVAGQLLYGARRKPQFGAASFGWRSEARGFGAVTVGNCVDFVRRVKDDSGAREARVTARIDQTAGGDGGVPHLKIEVPIADESGCSIVSFSVEFEIRDGGAIVVRSGQHGHPLDRP